ncbi:MAG: cysteine desulfurase family protein [Lachnospira sp.]
MIYLDNAATTSMKRQVLESMVPFLTSKYANPSGAYEFGAECKNAIEDARETIALCINAKPDNIIFTSGGTESDNWAIRSGIANNKKGHIITSRFEHHAILNTCNYIEEKGGKVSYADISDNGIVDMEKLEELIDDNTTLISVMAVNNEIGTIQPIEEIAAIADKHGIKFHTDAVAAFGHIPIDVERMGIDLMSVSGHKICGPKGVGFMYVRDNDINPFIFGGKQESGLRAGTENVAGIVGMATAVIMAVQSITERNAKEKIIRDHIIDRVLSEIPDSRLNGDVQQRVTGNMNFSFKWVDGGMLVAMLDRQGICASAGSACTSGSRNPSHVLKSIGLSDDLARGSIRFTINEKLTRREADYVVNCLKNNVLTLRQLHE